MRAAVYYMQINSPQDMFNFVADFFNMTEADRQYWMGEINQLGCSSPGEVPQCIQDGMNWIRESDFDNQVEDMIMGLFTEWGLLDGNTDMNQFFNMAPCRAGYHGELVKAFVNYMHDFYSAEERDEICE